MDINAKPITMKNYFIYLLVAILTLSSCEEDTFVYDAENGQTLVEFANTSAVIATPEEGASTMVDVFVTTKSSSDRTVSVEVDPASTAPSGSYQISDIMIPAGAFKGTMEISSSFDALPEQGTTSLIINITGVENSEAIVEKGTFTVDLFRKCPIVLEELVGTWSGPGSWSEDEGYETKITTFLNDDGELMMNGMAFEWFTGWWGEVIVTNEAVKVDVDLETGEITIPEQFYITSTYNGDPQPSYNIKATGMVLNACQKTLEIYPVFIQGGSAIDGTAWGSKFKETIQLN